jgi:hypothetical protein
MVAILPRENQEPGSTWRPTFRSQSRSHRREMYWEGSVGNSPVMTVGDPRPRNTLTQKDKTVEGTCTWPQFMELR